MSDYSSPPAPGTPPVPGPPPAPPAGFGPPAPGYAAPADYTAPAATGFGPNQPVASPYGGYAAPLAPPVPVPADRLGLGIAAGVGTAVVCALVYAGLIDGTKHEISYMALAVGLLVGLVIGKVGGRNPVLPVVGLVLAVLGVFCGEIIGEALLLAKYAGVGVTTALFSHFGVVFSAWKYDLSPMSFLFYAIAAVEGFVFTKRANGTMAGRRR